MKRNIFLIIVACYLGFNASAQNLGKYQYVQVPEKFEFLKEENQYQLNALTAFLLEKYGFEALYEEQTPSGIEPCDLLRADVHKESAILRSKVYVTLKNCNDEVIFTSKIGDSRKKDFKKSYHEALRDAFTSFEDIRDNPEILAQTSSNNVSEKAPPAEIVVDPVPVSSEVQDKEVVSEVIIDPVVTSEEIEAAKAENSRAESSFGAETVELVNANITYTLKSTPTGFELYRNTEKEKFATLIQSGGGENYLYSSKNISGNAFFDTQGNLVVEYIDPNSQQLISVKYSQKDQ